MRVSQNLPRISLTQWREVGTQAANCDAVAAAIASTNLHAKAPLLYLLNHIKQCLADLYNKGEAAINKDRARAGYAPVEDVPESEAAQAQAHAASESNQSEAT